MYSILITQTINDRLIRCACLIKRKRCHMNLITLCKSEDKKYENSLQTSQKFSVNLILSYIFVWNVLARPLCNMYKHRFNSIVTLINRNQNVCFFFHSLSLRKRKVYEKKREISIIQKDCMTLCAMLCKNSSYHPNKTEQFWEIIPLNESLNSK
jgi:hypothetical protein